MKSIREVMTHHVISLLERSTLMEAAGELAKHQISGAPVVDDRGRLVGIVSVSDISAHQGTVTSGFPRS